MSKRKMKPISVLKRIGAALAIPFVLLWTIFYWIFWHQDPVLGFLKLLSYALVILLIIVGVYYPTPSEQYESTYNECITIETLTEAQCHDIALEAID